MVMVEDDFIARICYQFNLLICIIFTIIKAGLKQYHGNYHYHAARNLFGLQGGPFDQKIYKRISFWYLLIVLQDLNLGITFLTFCFCFRFIGFPVMFSGLIIGICLSIIGFQKLKNKWVLRKFAEKTMKYNNTTHNPQVIKEKGKNSIYVKIP